jgi:leader peptidase (prepilin peptidase)/N-methyltransferase
MTNANLFPSMVLQMCAIGEESGSIDHMLGKAADFYEAEVDDMVAGISSLMEPIIIVILGTVIGGIVVAMYLPIFKLGRRLMLVSPGVDAALFGVLGLLVGSFLNVVIYRLPKMKHPRGSATWRSKASCSACKTAISMRYPLVEIATGVLFAWCAFRWAMSLTALAWCGFSAVARRADPDRLGHHLAARRPDAAAAVGRPDRLGAALDVGCTAGPIAIWGAVAGYMSLWLVYQAFKLLTGKEGMGYGDFKLFAALGAWFGWQALVPDHPHGIRHWGGDRHRNEVQPAGCARAGMCRSAPFSLAPG